MELTKTKQVCNSLDDIPDFKTIKSLKRGIEWKIVFGSKIKSKREKIGSQWKFEHPEFLISIHTIESEINIVKLITDKEIEECQDFFEKCAKDYRNLATKLINEFSEKHDVKIDPEYPMNTLRHTESFGYKPVGEMNGWRYAFHGIHCGLTNTKTGQRIEVPLTYGLEFGLLDPYFFMRFIKSTKEYQPLPVGIYCDYADGNRILEKMVKIGKFEFLNSNWPNEKGIVVSDREKIEVKVYNPNLELEEEGQGAIAYKNNSKNAPKSKDSNMNILWSKLKNLW
ncbi:DUF6896 domain-containing protein [Lacinutrix mariniflava]|uniref:DUF6896 domain-containing protein n=1 Tax=Lacinutrix mariniflava TaxID=342955 RepID=UPI000AA73339|nr:hypothetical protein [Lacinutrix mariniflava]